MISTFMMMVVIHGVCLMMMVVIHGMSFVMTVVIHVMSNSHIKHML